jgi:hypothetical protein
VTLTWKLITLILVIFGGLVFLVYEGKVDSQILEALVSAVIGGGMVHAGSKLGGGGQ